MALLKKKSDQTLNQNNNNNNNKNYPTSINDYKFEGRIGKGAFASVYVASCPSLNEKVAIKVIELELDDGGNKQQQQDGGGDNNGNNGNNNNNNDISWDEIQKEAAVMARMNHKNIVRCYTSFCVTTELWLVMPLLIGSCSDIMKSIKEFNNGFIEELIISTIIRDILHAVQYIHNDGRVHRDIKSANILLSSSGICQISDFGVSGAIIEGGLRKHGRDTFTGSLWWMSPEVLQRENRHSYKADIWSLGITTLELTFGKPPHSKQRPVKVMLTILQSPPPNIQSCLEEIQQSQSQQQSQLKYPKYSKKFKDFLSKCLQKDPNKRASASQLINHSFIKQAKDNKYLFDKIVSKYKQQQYNNNILPYSVSKQANKDINNNKNNDNNNNNNHKQNDDENKDNKNISNRIESNGFDFNSEIIHSISNSDPVSTPVAIDDDNDDNPQKLGRFDVKISNNDNNNNDNDDDNNNDNNNNNNNDTSTTTKKGRFRVKKIT